MFEEYTFERIKDELLSLVPSDVSTYEGSLIYNAVVPIAYEAEKLYIGI